MLGGHELESFYKSGRTKDLGVASFAGLNTRAYFACETSKINCSLLVSRNCTWLLFPGAHGCCICTHCSCIALVV